MKTKFFIAFASLAFLFTACQKDNDDTTTDPDPNNTEDYQPVSAGSTWQYASTTTGNYSETALGGDTTIGGEKYFILDNSENGRRYINKNNGVYKSSGYIQAIQQSVNMTYLKDAPAGTTWEDNLVYSKGLITVPVAVKYTIASRDGDKVVNNKTYNNVIAVDLALTANSVLIGGLKTIATGRQFYAKGVGNIGGSLHVDVLDIQIDDSTYLVSHDIK